MCPCSKSTIIPIISSLCIGSFSEMTSSPLLCSLLTNFLFHTGKRSSPGGVSNQKETGLPHERVSDRRQRRYRQLQHPSPAAGHAPGAAEEPAAGTLARRRAERDMKQSNICQQRGKLGEKLGHSDGHGKRCRKKGKTSCSHVKNTN